MNRLSWKIWLVFGSLSFGVFAGFYAFLKYDSGRLGQLEANILANAVGREFEDVSRELVAIGHVALPFSCRGNRQAVATFRREYGFLTTAYFVSLSVAPDCLITSVTYDETPTMFL